MVEIYAVTNRDENRFFETVKFGGYITFDMIEFLGLPTANIYLIIAGDERAYFRVKKVN